MRVLEWFSGIGGTAAAVADTDATVVQAIDHDELAHRVYTQWWGPHAVRRNIASIKPAKLHQAQLWWMSPPCQPYTVRGQRRDLEDRRSAALLNLLALMDTLRPAHIALENVPGFEDSDAHHRLADWLHHAGYSHWWGHLCPTDLGIPMIRRRFFLVASREVAVRAPTLARIQRPLPSNLDQDPPDTDIDADTLERFQDAFHTVDATDADAVAACFTGAYAHSPVYAGSYLRTPTGLRLFAPSEILRLMGFPEHCRLPPDIPRRKAYKLVGNSVSVDCVRAALTCLAR